MSSGKEAYAKIRAGASLVQLYTALAYRGPGLITEIKHDLHALLASDGFDNISQAIGADSRREFRTKNDLIASFTSNELRRRCINVAHHNACRIARDHAHWSRRCLGRIMGGAEWNGAVALLKAWLVASAGADSGRHCSWPAPSRSSCSSKAFARISFPHASTGRSARRGRQSETAGQDINFRSWAVRFRTPLRRLTRFAAFRAETAAGHRAASMAHRDRQSVIELSSRW